MLDLLRRQYGYIRSARHVLLEFLAGLPPATLHQAVPGFGHPTIIDTHVHAAKSYGYWFGTVVFKREVAGFPDQVDERLGTDGLRAMWESVDSLVDDFVAAYGDRWSVPLTCSVHWREDPIPLTPLFLLTHTQTHEFHHKGQILAMARHLGHPVPSDAMGGLRFSEGGS